jgi:hypothetical protein
MLRGLALIDFGGGCDASLEGGDELLHIAKASQ